MIKIRLLFALKCGRQILLMVETTFICGDVEETALGQRAEAGVGLGCQHPFGSAQTPCKSTLLKFPSLSFLYRGEEVWWCPWLWLWWTQTLNCSPSLPQDSFCERRIIFQSKKKKKNPNSASWFYWCLAVNCSMSFMNSHHCHPVSGYICKTHSRVLSAYGDAAIGLD